MPTFTQDELEQLVAECATLYERLDGFVVPVDNPDNETRIEQRLEHWKRVVAKGNTAGFQKRLEWDGLTIDQVRPLLGAVRLAQPDKLPFWALLARDLLAMVTPESVPASYRFLKADKKVAFEDVLAPMVAEVSRRIAAQVGSAIKLLSETAHIVVERTLLLTLSQLVSRPLDIAFALFRGKQRPLTLLPIEQAEAEGGTAIYRAFVEAQAEGDFLALCKQHPTLTRLLGTLTHYWIEAQCEFLSRLEADLPEIITTFEQHPGAVIDLDLRLSDPHKNRRNVFGLEFESGLKLVYKPRDLSFEVAYFRLLDWINARGVGLPFKCFRVINRHRYGWVEFIRYTPVDSEASFKHFYHRMGLLLGLLHTLNCTDVHHENIIAHGEHPALVDMETLLFPEIRSAEEILDEGQPTLIHREFSQSVMNVGLLPQWDVAPDGRVYDVSGLGRVEPLEVSVPIWVNTNTDDMALQYQVTRMEDSQNVPFVEREGQAVLANVDHFFDEIITGFREIYAFLMEHRDALLAADGPIAAFEDKQVRFIFRATRIYGSLMDRLLNPETMRGGFEQSMVLELLTRAFLLFQRKPPTWPVMQIEARALAQLDVPYFAVNTAHDALVLPTGQTIDRIFLLPSFAACQAHVRALSTGDRERQLAFVRGALYSRQAREQGNAASVYGAVIDPATPAPLSASEMIAEAVRIGELLRANAVSDSNSASWLSFELNPGGRYQFVPMGRSLYDGISGIIVFLSALERITGEKYSDLMEAATRPGFREMEDPEARYRMVRDMGIGGGSGAGSVIYGLALSSKLSGSEAGLAYAKRLVPAITQEVIEQDTTLDVLSGSAGAILGLLAYHALTDDAAALEQAHWCGQHLLRRRKPSAAGFRAWATINGNLLTGFSHGAAGIAYALLRLYAKTGESAYREAAEEAIAYESSVYAPRERNWPDYRGNAETPGYRLSWCHGAPGIGLARLGGLSVLDTPQVRSDIENALLSTHNIFAEDLDHLCCGILGRSEMLLTASRALKRPELLDFVARSAGWIVSGAKQKQGYSLFWNLPTSALHFGFFQGYSGIGYELLRIAQPDVLPAVLLWDI